MVPLYGDRGDAAGFPERVCQRLAESWDLEVLTTCARDDRTWADFHTPGRTVSGRLTVQRFRVDYPRSPAIADRLDEAVLDGDAGPELERRWLEETGPYSSSLVGHLEETAAEYDLFLFFAYGSPTTVHGLPMVAGRAALAPMSRDEPRLRLGIFRPVFAAARALVFASAVERDLVLARFAPSAPHAIAGLPPGDIDPAAWDRVEATLRDVAARGR